MRRLIAFWALLLCLGTAQAQVRDFDRITESGTLRVALYQSFPPYSYEQDGQPRGVDYELAKALAEGLGLAEGVANGLGDGLGLTDGSGKTIGGSTLKRSTDTLTPAALPVGIFVKKNGPTSTAFGAVPRSFS